LQRNSPARDSAGLLRFRVSGWWFLNRRGRGGRRGKPKQFSDCFDFRCAEFRESLLPGVAGRLSQQRAKNQGDTDLTDETDSTDRYSVGSAPAQRAAKRSLTTAHPSRSGSPSSARSIPRSLSKIRPGSWGVEASASERTIRGIRLIRGIRNPLVFLAALIEGRDSPRPTHPEIRR